MSNSQCLERSSAGACVSDRLRPRAVILLTFDRLSAHGLSWPPDDAGSSPAEVFGQLDLSATFFEQHYSQDLSGAAPDFGTFGTPEQRARFQQLLEAAGIRQHRMLLCPEDRSASDPHRTSSGDTAAGAGDGGTPDGFARHRKVPEQIADPDGGPQFFWMHVSRCGTKSHTETPVIRSPGSECEVLRDVLALCRGEARTQGLPVALIVTAVRGGRKMPAAPFQSQLAEDEVRVPLWLDPGDGQFCRVGAISGSFDVLPTVADLFGISADWCAAGTPDLPGELSHQTQPRSLFPLCREPGQSSPRILIVRTPARLAVRSDHYLLVRSHLQDANDPHVVASDPAALPCDTWLYVKPEDFWNVHDQAGVYQDVIPELRQYLPPQTR